VDGVQYVHVSSTTGEKGLNGGRSYDSFTSSSVLRVLVMLALREGVLPVVEMAEGPLEWEEGEMVGQ
jgi:hypothetical protein